MGCRGVTLAAGRVGLLRIGKAAAQLKKRTLLIFLLILYEGDNNVTPRM
jgi:hypothetical protein